MKTLITSLAAGGLLLVGAAQAADPSGGQDIAKKQCAACHGEDGNSSVPLYPKLAGQHADYLERALADYQSGARSNPIMAPLASALSDADRASVAAWYASQEGGVHTMADD